MSDEIFKAFIGGLPYDSITSDVETLLKFCEFTDDDIKKMEIHLVHDRETGNFKGFCYVTFPNEQQLETAISTLNGVDFEKRVLKVNRAQQRDRNDRGGRGGGRGGFGGDRGGRGGGRGGADRDGFQRVGGGGRGGHRGDRFGDRDGGSRSFGGGGGRGGYRQRKESEEAGSVHEDRQSRQSDDGPSSAPAERPRLNLKPRSTDASELEARQKKEAEETKKRQEKLFG